MGELHIIFVGILSSLTERALASSLGLELLELLGLLLLLLLESKIILKQMIEFRCSFGSTRFSSYLIQIGLLLLALLERLQLTTLKMR